MSLRKSRSVYNLLLEWSLDYLQYQMVIYLLTLSSTLRDSSLDIFVNLLTFENICYFWTCVMLCYEFLSRIASSVLRVNCYQWGSCVGGPSAFNSPFGHRSRSHNICPLDNHLSGLSISLSSLVLNWVYRLPFFKSLIWLGCDSNSQVLVLVASALPLYYQSVHQLVLSSSLVHGSWSFSRRRPRGPGPGPIKDGIPY